MSSEDRNDLQHRVRPAQRRNDTCPLRRPLPGTLPGAATYVVLAIWAAAVTTAIVADVFAGDGASRLLLPAAQAIPIAAAAIGYRASPRFRNYLLALDLRLVLTAQLWRVIGSTFLFALAFGQLSAGFAVPAGIGDLATGIAALAVVLSLGNGTLTRGRLYAFTALGVADFLVANATGLSLEPSALTAWPLAIFPTLMIPFFVVLHLVAMLQSRHDWDDRVRHYTIPSRDLAPTPPTRKDRSDDHQQPYRHHIRPFHIAGGSPMGRVYRETAPAMLARVTAALDERIGRALAVAAYLLREGRDSRVVGGGEAVDLGWS